VARIKGRGFVVMTVVMWRAEYRVFEMVAKIAFKMVGTRE
jgi:hypothetical protein